MFCGMYFLHCVTVQSDVLLRFVLIFLSIVLGCINFPDLCILLCLIQQDEQYVLFCTIICIIFTSLCKNRVKLTWVLASIENDAHGIEKLLLKLK